VDYYTVPVLDQSVLLRETRETADWNGTPLGFGDVTVTWFTSFFKKIQFLSVDSIGYGILDLPPQDIETTAFWIAPRPELRRKLRAAGKNPVEGLAGLRNLLVSVVSLHAMCDRADLGGVVESKNLGMPAVFLYDRYPGGLGFAEQAFRRPAEVLADCLTLVEECPCAGGCPSCVGLPVLRPAQHQDPEIGRSWPIPDKETARMILRDLVPAALRRAASTPGIEAEPRP
jgi:DEAD/DEAH box helicase domain-containing protein